MKDVRTRLRTDMPPTGPCTIHGRCTPEFVSSSSRLRRPRRRRTKANGGGGGGARRIVSCRKTRARKTSTRSSLGRSQEVDLHRGRGGGGPSARCCRPRRVDRASANPERTCLLRSLLDPLSLSALPSSPARRPAGRRSRPAARLLNFVTCRRRNP